MDATAARAVRAYLRYQYIGPESPRIGTALDMEPWRRATEPVSGGGGMPYPARVTGLFLTNLRPTIGLALCLIHFACDAAAPVDAIGESAASGDGGASPSMSVLDGAAKQPCRPYYGGPLQVAGHTDDFTRSPAAVALPDLALVFEPPMDAVYVASLLSDSSDIEVWLLHGDCGGTPLNGTSLNQVYDPGAQWAGRVDETYTLVVEIPPDATWVQVVLASYCEGLDADCVVDGGSGLVCGVETQQRDGIVCLSLD